MNSMHLISFGSLLTSPAGAWPQYMDERWRLTGSPHGMQPNKIPGINGDIGTNGTSTNTSANFWPWPSGTLRRHCVGGRSSHNAGCAMSTPCKVIATPPSAHPPPPPDWMLPLCARRCTWWLFEVLPHKAPVNAPSDEERRRRMGSLHSRSHAGKIDPGTRHSTNTPTFTPAGGAIDFLPP